MKRKMKGIFYSAIVILFVIPLVFFAAVYMESVRTSSEGFASKAVSDKMASFAKSINNDLPRATKIIARRSIEANIQHVELYGTPLDDAEKRITEAMMNGTVYGNTTVLDDFTLVSWSDIIAAKGAEYGFSTSINITSVNITSLDSYDVAVGVIITVNITDSTASTNLYRIYDTTFPVSIAGIIDPLYLLKTNGLIKRTINPPTETVYGVASLDNAVTSAYYMQSLSGANFLDRMEGRLTSSSGGLESFVYLPDLQANGLEIKPDQNSADYLYFDDATNPGQQVNNSAYTWLRLNAEQAVVYGVTII